MIDLDYFENQLKKWIGKTKSEREQQWNEIMKPFDLFERVRDKTASKLVLIPLKELLAFNSYDKYVRSHWNQAVGTKTPDVICYVIFDTTKKITFLGLFQNNI